MKETGRAGTTAVPPLRPAIRHPRHSACPARAPLSRTRRLHSSRGRGTDGLLHPARWRAQVTSRASTSTAAPAASSGPAVLNDWFRRATALADAFREESRSKS